MRLMTFLSILCLPLWGCSDAHEEATKPHRTLEPVSYIATEDLDGIRQRGTLRLIAPRFDGADALPREGLSVQDYQGLAEDFAETLGVDIIWVFVDGFDNLIPTLVRGEGDIIVTNLTNTKSRREEVDFTRAITQVSEIVVTPKSLDIGTAEALKNYKLTIPEGTVYAETLDELGLSEVINYVPATTSSFDLLAGVSEGLYVATVVDSDVLRELLPEFPALNVDFTLRKNRPIGWAVRKDNDKLRSALNQFLISHHLQQATTQFNYQDWPAIKKSGRLRVLTLNNPASYFMWRGELMGFDYDLMRHFAAQHDLHLSVVIKKDIASLFTALKRGEGDVIAASLTPTAAREQASIVFSKRYLEVAEQVVGLSTSPTLASLSEVANYTVGVNPDTSFYDPLKALFSEASKGKLQRLKDATTEELIRRMVQAEFDFVLADSHLVAIEQSYHQDIEVRATLNENADIAWGLRTDQPELKRVLDAYIDKEYRGLFYNVTFNKYFKNEKKIKKYQEGRVADGDQLSPYDSIVKTYAKKYHMDWRLLVAQMYQESKFDPDAQSFAGAQGLMQVLPRTAKELGIGDLRQPENAIAAGTMYMDWLERRFPGELDFHERIYFTLAAYNAGTGHVRDARVLARQLGYDANKWFGHVEFAMLKLSDPEHYQSARFGYVRGAEPVEYVRSIRDRYLGYINR